MRAEVFPSKNKNLSLNSVSEGTKAWKNSICPPPRRDRIPHLALNIEGAAPFKEKKLAQQLDMMHLLKVAVWGCDIFGIDAGRGEVRSALLGWDQSAVLGRPRLEILKR